MDAQSTSPSVEVVHLLDHMPQCHNGILQIRETQPQTPILCDGLAPQKNMNWTITDHNGPRFEIATCLDYNRNYTCESTDADFSSARTVPVSQLVMKNYARDKVVNKTLTCIRRDGANPAEISRRNVTLIGWNVTATVVIDKVYDSDRDVVCLWNMTGPNSIQLIQYQRPKLSPLAEDADSPMYDHGACSVSIPVNATEGVYRVFLTVMPAGGPVAVGSVTLKKPGPLLRLQACPQYIAEGSNLECTCRHVSSLQGSPPARVTWLNYDDTSVLRVSNVRREQNGTTYTCRSVWGPNNDVTRTSDYTLRVAYGPSSASVTSQANVTDDTHLVALTCTAHDVYPSANFTWSVPCLTLDLTSPVSTCTLAQETMRNVTEVVCLAINTEVPVNAWGVYTAPVLNQPVTPEDNGDSPLALIAGGSVAAAVVVIVIIVVIVVIVVKRKGKAYKDSSQ
ncbi:uncharacterized protein, partial [Littorina saxatilis]|uniref:uncharacterized protein n=1 Tax=Littorina saxatilis TaxID=31220 RepID=UPI0038B53CAD